MAIKSVKDVKRKEYYIFSPFLRIFHWIMASQIVVLFVTGLLITKPMNVGAVEPVFTNTSMDLVRDIHFLAAFILCASLIMRIYGFIINKGVGRALLRGNCRRCTPLHAFERSSRVIFKKSSGSRLLRGTLCPACDRNLYGFCNVLRGEPCGNRLRAFWLGKYPRRLRNDEPLHSSLRCVVYNPVRYRAFVHGYSR